VLFEPRHPYTRALIESLPEAASEGPLISIAGSPPDPANVPEWCAFEPRCRFATRECTTGKIPFHDVGPGRRSRCIHVDRLAATPLAARDGVHAEEPDAV